MKYTPPILIDLSTARHTARGQGPLACIPGSAAAGVDESCAPGNAADWDCSGGGAPSTTGDTCVGGDNPGMGGYGDCGTGTSPTYCVGGSAVGVDPYGCRTGPSAV